MAIKTLDDLLAEGVSGRGVLVRSDLNVPLDDNGEIINSENLKVHPRMKELYKFFKFNGKVIDIDDFDRSTLQIFSRVVLKMISKGKRGWEEMLPAGIANMIKKDKLFGFDPEKVLEEKA